MSETKTADRSNKAKAKSDRLSILDGQAFKADSLVGSYFHRYDDEDGELTWQGCVTAEVAPGVYLVELFEWIVGTSSAQRLVWLADMRHWRFYDDPSWMANAYHDYAAQREARKRAEAEP